MREDYCDKIKINATFLSFKRLNSKGGEILLREEKELIRGLKKGNEKAYRELVELYGNRLIKTCYLILKDEKEAEDIVQETFLKVFSKIHSFKGKSSLYTWIYQIALNLSRDRLRARKDFIIYEDRLQSDEGLENLVIDTIDRETLRKELFNLNHIYREVLILFYFEDLSIKDICSVLEEREGTIKSRLSRGRVLLREAIEKGGKFHG